MPALISTNQMLVAEYVTHDDVGAHVKTSTLSLKREKVAKGPSKKARNEVAFMAT